MALARAASTGLDAARRALSDLETALEPAIKDGLNDPSTATAWRTAHRRGTPSRIQTDPELRAFILARIHRLTFDAIVTEIAATFPPERRTSRSALHRWWHKTGKHQAPPIGKS